MNIFIVPQIIHGKGALRYLGMMRGKKVAIIYGQVAKSLGFVDRIEECLGTANMEICHFNRMEFNPTMETVERGAVFLQECKPDWIIALGGGSSIDLAKAMWILAENPGIEIFDKKGVMNAQLQQVSKFIAIPTTSGTGSEVSRFSVIDQKESAAKIEIFCKQLIPHLVILDPEFLNSMPAELVATTGADALTHAIEAFVGLAKNEFSDAYALSAIQLVFENLEKSYKNQNDLNAREKMQYAASMAGISFNNSQLGIAHSLAHALSAVFKISHGKCLTSVLISVIQYNSKCVSNLYQEIGRRINLYKNSEEKTVDAFIRKIKDLFKELQMPMAIKELGIAEEDFSRNLGRLAESAHKSICTAGNPREVTEENLRKILNCAYRGLDIDF